MKVVTSGPLPAEVAAYTLARYSRSADSFEESLDWVKSHDSGKFLEDFYFKFGHPSIADLGHVIFSLEGISEIAAVEVLDQELLDCMQRSTRYQDFSKAEPVVPRELDPQQEQAYREMFASLLDTYSEVHAKVSALLKRQNPKPAEMKPEQYERTINARAFDVSRYLLPMGIQTSVGQVCSIRTLEKQVRRLMSSDYEEVLQLGLEMKDACGDYPNVYMHPGVYPSPEDRPVAPTLAKYLEPSEYLKEKPIDLLAWYANTVQGRWGVQGVFEDSNTVRLYRDGENLFPGTSVHSLSPTILILANLLYPCCNGSFEEVVSFLFSLSHEQIQAGFDAAVAGRGAHDELPREFRNQPYIFEFVLDLGAYRDLHRHRRCVQIAQPYSTNHGYEIPDLVYEARCDLIYSNTIEGAHDLYCKLWPSPGAPYILPLATRIRCLFEMDFAEAEYICKLRTKVGGHPSYRKLTWQAGELLKQAEPYLGKLIQTTNPEVEAVLQR